MHCLLGHLNILGKLTMKEILNGVWQNRFEQLLGTNWKVKKIITGNFGWVDQMERTISIWSDRNVRDQLWRWSTLTGSVISVGRTEMSHLIWQNFCPMYRSFVSCLQEQ